MNTNGHQPRSGLDRLIDRIGCLIVMVPIGATVLLAVSQVFQVPVVWLLLGVVVFATLGGSTPPAPPKGGTRRPSTYQRTKRVIDMFEDGQITEAERDKRLKEISND